jgi:hypothetical protein
VRVSICVLHRHVSMPYCIRCWHTQARIHVYGGVYIFVYIYIHIHTHIDIYACVSAYICSRALGSSYHWNSLIIVNNMYMHLRETSARYVCVCVCMYVCMYVSHVRVYACMCVYVCIHACEY